MSLLFEEGDDFVNGFAAFGCGFKDLPVVLIQAEACAVAEAADNCFNQAETDEAGKADQRYTQGWREKRLDKVKDCKGK